MKESKNMSLASRNSARWRNNPYYRFHRGSKKRREDINEAIDAEDMKFIADASKNDLNSDLWDEGGKMKPEIRKHLMKVAHEFYKFLDIDAELKDVTVTGSMANYNWHNASDIDLHLIIDFSEVDSNKELVRNLMDMKKAYWGLIHDIQVKNHDVELYAQDEVDEHHSTGVYSLRNNDWIEKPEKKSEINVDKDKVKKKAEFIATQIDALPGVGSAEDRIEFSTEIKDKIKKMRKSGLESGGEYSPENLAFKVLRNTGYLEKLSDIKLDAMDDSLTLDENIEEKAESKAQQRFFGIVRALQTGDIKPSKATKKAREAAKNMKVKDVLDFAETKHKGLPNEKNEDAIPGGLADGKSPKDFDKDALKKGVEIEMEHTSDAKIAMEIAMDHLTEDPDYYDKLEKVEGSGDNRGYGCLMSFLDIPTWENKILSKIDPEDLYEEEGFGLEHEPHATILYGFHDDEVDRESVMKEVNKNCKDPIKMKLNGVSHFGSKDYDVIKFDITSGDLKRMNKIMRDKFPYSSDYPDYHPHATIAYVKKGMGPKYASKFKKPILVESNYFVYSTPDRDKTHWLNKDKNLDRHIEFNANNGTNELTVLKGGDMDPKKIDYIQDFISFVCDNIEMENPIHVFLRHGRDNYIRTTASYVPSENTNHINCEGRKLVDICRSIAHELTHNRQREIEKIVPGKPVPNIGGECENEADSVAGMLIKYYTHNNGHDDIYDM